MHFVAPITQCGIRYLSRSAARVRQGCVLRPLFWNGVGQLADVCRPCRRGYHFRYLAGPRLRFGSERLGFSVLSLPCALFLLRYCSRAHGAGEMRTVSMASGAFPHTLLYDSRRDRPVGGSCQFGSVKHVFVLTLFCAPNSYEPRLPIHCMFSVVPVSWRFQRK